jgi:hypothetical protein
MTVPALLLVPAAEAGTLSPSTTAETAATVANRILDICSPHGWRRPGAVTSQRCEANLLVGYTHADITVKA